MKPSTILGTNLKLKQPVKRKKPLQNRQVTKKSKIVVENETSKTTKLNENEIKENNKNSGRNRTKKIKENNDNAKNPTKENENKNDEVEEKEDTTEECPDCSKIFNSNSLDETLKIIAEHWREQHEDSNDKTDKKDDKLEENEDNNEKLGENEHNNDEKEDESHMDKENEIIERGQNNDDENHDNHKMTNIDNDNIENDGQDSHDEEEKEIERNQMNKNIENSDELPNLEKPKNDLKKKRMVNFHIPMNCRDEILEESDELPTFEKPKNDLKEKEKMCELCSEEFENKSMKLVHMEKHITSTTQSKDHPLVSFLRPKTVRIWRKRLDKWKKSPLMLTPSQIRKRKLKKLGTSIHEVKVVTIKTKKGITTKVIHKIRAEKLQHRRKPKENRKEISKETETTSENDDCIDETEAKLKKQTEKTDRKKNEDKCCPLFIKEETEVINGKTVKTAIVLNPTFHGKSKREFCDKHKEDVNEMHESNW